MPSPYLLELQSVSKTYHTRKQPLHALSEISLAIPAGQTLGIAGGSGSGKSTLGKLLLSIESPTSGIIRYKGKEIEAYDPHEKQYLRRQLQMVFQDPYSSLNPRMTVRQIIAEGIEIHKLCHGAEKEERIDELLDQVGLNAAFRNRYPHELSGGQRQRIGIARAFAVNPEFIVLDEPLSALDICTQKQITELLIELKEKKKLTYLFISHNLKAIRKIADHIAILHRGKLVEQGPTEQIFNSPSHSYTRTLLDAIPQRSS